MRSFLPKSLFGILLSFIAGIFLIFALITGSINWKDAKEQQDAVLEMTIHKVVRLYELDRLPANKPPRNLKPAPPHIQKKVRDYNPASEVDVKAYFLPGAQDEHWLNIANTYWYRQNMESLLMVWLKNFAPNLILMMTLVALSALFLSYYIKKPLSTLTQCLAYFKHEHKAPCIEPTGPKELQEVTKQCSSMMVEIEGFEAQRQLVLAGVAHDIRTPLARIRVAIEMIPQLADDKRNALISDIEQISHLQSQFLDYTRADNAAPKQDIDINGIVAECAGQYPAQDISLDLGEGKIIVHGEAAQLYRALDNVLNNAFKYGAPPVNIKTQLENNTAVIIINDHGEGVPEAELQNLTQPLYRSDDARGDCEGTGLGLSIVARCMQHMHGQLELANAPNAGLQVTLKLPI